MRGHRYFWLLAPAAFLLDRVTKIWAQAALFGGYKTVIPSVFRLIYVENTGMAFGLLPGKQLPLLVITGTALAGLLVWLVLRGGRRPTFENAALWLLLGGALGNFYDRLFLGYVIDFLQIEWFNFPVFNVADICVCAAFVLLAGYILLAKEEKPDAA